MTYSEFVIYIDYGQVVSCPQTTGLKINSPHERIRVMREAPPQSRVATSVGWLSEGESDG